MDLSVPPTGEIDLVIEKSPKETVLIEIKARQGQFDKTPGQLQKGFSKSHLLSFINRFSG